MRSALVAVLLALALLPSVTAQAHAHGATGSVAIVLERTDIRAGGLLRFTVLDLGDDAIPDFHQQNHVRVSLNGAVLLETTPDSGHDYDGVLPFDVQMPREGSYVVEVLDKEGQSLASASGRVVGEELHAGGLSIDGFDSSFAAGEMVDLVFRVDGDTNATAPFDAIVEVARDDVLVWRGTVTGETGEKGAAWRYAFQVPGLHALRVTARSPDGNFPTMTIENLILVRTPSGLETAAPSVPASPQPSLNAVVTAEAGPVTLVGTFDPYTVVGTNTLQHVAVLAMDAANRQPVTATFDVTWIGPGGQVLASYAAGGGGDPVLQLAGMGLVPGPYRVHVEASGTLEGTPWDGSLDLPYHVAPPVVAAPAVAFAVGPQVYDIEGLEGLASGVETQVRMRAHDLAGNPFAHSEVEATLFAAGPDGMLVDPVLHAKLHTHADGAFAWNMTLDEGNYMLVLSPFPLLPQPAGPFSTSGADGSLRVPVQVGAGPGFPEAPAQDRAATAPPTAAAPGLVPVLALAALAAIAAVRRMRTVA